MDRKIFITATGTDAGKTYVSALILKHLRESGINSGYYKPALSGAYHSGGRLIPGDAEYVCSLSGLDVPPETLVSYCFERAVSPHLAAVCENRAIEMQKIAEDFKRISAEYEYMVIEGCGGIICPLRLDDKTIMLEDIIKLLGADIIIVASAGLGTINSTLLTVEYARAKGIGIRGIVLNRYDERNFMHTDNKRQIEKLTHLPVLACVADNADSINIDILN